MAGTDSQLTDAERKLAVHSRRMICADVDANNNKFWHGWALADGTYVSEYGRVGETPRVDRRSIGVEAAKNKVEADRKKRLNYKLPKKKPYVDQKTLGDGAVSSGHSGKRIDSTSLKATAVKQIETGGNPYLTKLLGWLAEINIHLITGNTNIAYDLSSGTFSTPLGPVTADAIIEARQLLNVIADGVQKRAWNQDNMKQAISGYMMLIPQDVGRNRSWPEQVFGPADAIQKQGDILDSLDASIQAITADKTTKPKETEARVFNVKLDLIQDGKVIDKVRSKYKSDKGSHYDVATLDVKRVFGVDISTVSAAFAQGCKVGNIMQLWHGTKASNLLSILKGGLIIPPTSSSHVTGRMFGNGLYFSDQSTKSLRYATNAWGGGGRTDRTFMFLCDVAMGKPHYPSGYGGGRIPAGHHSIFAKAGRSGVQNNEMIVPRTNQANLVYLIEFTPHGR
jgi:poly [ADP-ribose] polymerase 2/3/4